MLYAENQNAPVCRYARVIFNNILEYLCTSTSEYIFFTFFPRVSLLKKFKKISYLPVA